MIQVAEYGDRHASPVFYGIPLRARSVLHVFGAWKVYHNSTFTGEETSVFRKRETQMVQKSFNSTLQFRHLCETLIDVNVVSLFLQVSCCREEQGRCTRCRTRQPATIGCLGVAPVWG